MRERLIGLILNAPRTDVVYGNIKLDKPIQTAQTIADYLLENGVVELPCAVGDTVYVPWCYAGQRGIAVTSVKEIRLYNTNPSDIMFFIDLESDNECFNMSFGGWKTTRCIGKTVFLTKEEAEKALERSEGIK